MPAANEDKRSASAVDIAMGIGPIADLSAPTVAEITALQRIECLIVGSSPFSPGRSVVTSSARSQCDSESFDVPVAITNANITMGMWRYFDGEDLAWTLMDDTVLPRVKNYVAVCDAGFTGAVGPVTNLPGEAAAPAAGDVVNIYEILIGSRSPAYGQDQLQMFNVEIGVIGTRFDVALVA